MIEPLEIIVPRSGDADAREMIKLYKADNSDKNVTVEEAADELFTDGCKRLQTVLGSESKLAQLLSNLNDSSAGCLVVLVEYLRQFGMEAAIVATDSLAALNVEETMRLPAITFRNLELFQSSGGNGGRRGSLFHALNRTRTRMGARMFRDWMAAPLTNVERIKERQDAITFLMQPGNEISSNFRHRAFFRSVDLEVALMAVLYRKIRPADFFRLCGTMHKLYNEAIGATESLSVAGIPILLKKILDEIILAFDKSGDLCTRIDEQAAKDLKWERLFKDYEFAPDVKNRENEILELEANFESHTREIMKKLGLFSFKYSTVSGLEYLIEVKQTAANSVPKDWIKINSTKQVARFRSPFLVSNLPKLQYLRECLVSDCKKAWASFLDEIVSSGLAEFQNGAKRVAELDCLISMAEVARRDGFCLPQFNGDGVVCIEKGRNIVVERSLSVHEQFVPNDVNLARSGTRALVLTGPNMGGKSCYIRQLGTIAIMAQIGGYVPAARANLPVFDGLFVR